MNKLQTLIITAVLGGLCACQDGSVSEKTVEDSIVVDSSLHIALVQIAETERLFGPEWEKWADSAGIDAKIDTFWSAMDADTAFLRGHSHILITDSVKTEFLKKEIGKNDSVIILHKDSLTLSLITTKSSRIKNIKSLKDKIIAVTRNSAVDYTADKITAKAQLPAEALNRPLINDIRIRKQMLMLGQYDGAILPEPFATECEDSGANRVFTLKEPILRVVTTRKAKDKFGKEMEIIMKKMTERKLSH